MSEKKIIKSVQLTWEDPISQEMRVESFSFPITLGRDTNSHVVLSSTTVSRNHAEIILEGEQVMLHDLDSSNGSFINGQQISKAEIPDHSTLQLGDIQLRVSFSEDRPRRPSRDYLFSALTEGENEPTISLSSLDQKSLFADVEDEEKMKQAQSAKFETTEKLSGEELKQFLSGKLQKDLDQDIAPDIQEVASAYSGQREARAAKSTTKPLASDSPPADAEQPADDTLPSKPAEEADNSPMGRVWAALRRLWGG